MMNALDLLKFRLSRGGMLGGGQAGQPFNQNELGMLGAMSGALPPRTDIPPGLPPEVLRSFAEQPSTVEGQRPMQNRNDTYQTLGQPLFQQELQAMKQFGGPQREDRLLRGLQDNRIMGQTEMPFDEGGGLTTRLPGESPFASPLNQMMQLGRRSPLALY